jgi:signal transduction histidine kinase
MSIEADRELLAIVVHELRSPVAALAAISEAVMRDSSEIAGRRELVRLTIAACHGIARTLADANVSSVRLERLDVRPIVEDAVAAARLEGADARSEIESGLARIDADPERLRQALDNLLANAMTHADGSPIVVGARMVGACVVLSVSDRGKGIALADQARIFEPGTRLQTSRPGSGLGLALTRAIAVAHGGSVAVESTPGKGSTFSLELPVAASRQASQ